MKVCVLGTEHVSDKPKIYKHLLLYVPQIFYRNHLSPPSILPNMTRHGSESFYDDDEAGESHPGDHKAEIAGQC